VYLFRNRSSTGADRRIERAATDEDTWWND
jgi:hypothetical protein